MDDFDDLLSRLDALHDFLSERFGFHPLNEIARHLKIHVRLQQCEAHLTQRLTGVFLGDFAQATQVAESVLKFAA